MKITNAIAHARSTQFGRKRKQMIIVHPDAIIRLDEVGERLRKASIDAQIACIVGA